MASRDNHSNQVVRVALAQAAISTNTTTNGVIIDTADYGMGVKFAFNVASYTDGTYTVSFQEGDAADLLDATAVPADKIIGTAPVLSAVSGGSLPSCGVHSTKRYVRAVVTSTGVTTGATVGGVVVLSGEYNPQ